MKVTTNKQTGFQPVSLTITFESQRELDAFGAIFNYAPVCDTLRAVGFDPSEPRAAASELGANTSISEISRLMRKNI